MYRFSGKPLYVLPSITGLTAWVDYLPVKAAGESGESRYTATGSFDAEGVITSTTGLVAWVDYIPVYESALTVPWSTSGYIPFDEITQSYVLMETGDALLLESGDILLV